MTRCSTLPPTPTCGTAWSIRAQDLEQNTVATSIVLEAMRAAACHTDRLRITGSVYGEPEVFPTPENCPFPIQTSLYGASKLAGEGMIQAYCHGLRLHGDDLSVRVDPW